MIAYILVFLAGAFIGYKTGYRISSTVKPGEWLVGQNRVCKDGSMSGFVYPIPEQAGKIGITVFREGPIR